MEMAMWEQIALGAIVLLLLFWYVPGIKATFKHSREAESDWTGFLKPIAVVIMFIILLIIMA